MGPSKTIWHLEVVLRVPADINIANSVESLPIAAIAKDLNLGAQHYDLYGKYNAKVLLSVLDELKGSDEGYYVVVNGITSTPLGEGKSTTTVGLYQALGAFHDKKRHGQEGVRGMNGSVGGRGRRSGACDGH